MRVDENPFTRDELYRSLEASFATTYAEIRSCQTKRTKTAHLECNTRITPPGPSRAEMKAWASDQFPEANRVVMNPIREWNGVSVSHWDQAGPHVSVYGNVASTTEMDQATAEEHDLQTAREMFDQLEKEDSEPPERKPFMPCAIPDNWTPKDLTRFLSKWAAYINGTSLYILKVWSPEKQVFVLKTLSEKDMRNSMQGFSVEYDEGTSKKKYTGIDFMTGEMPRYANAVFNPASPHPKTNITNPEYTRGDRRIFNLFRGMPFKYRDGFSYTGPACESPEFLPGRNGHPMPPELLTRYGLEPGHPAELFVRHAFEVLADGNVCAFDYLMKWTAHIFQHPNAKPGTAILVVSPQGAGKNVWFDILKRLIGSDYFAYIKNKDHLQSKFNSHLMHKLLAVVDECVFGGCHEVNNIIKSLITQEDAIFEKKGVDGIHTSTYERYAFLSNEDWPVKVEHSDRRYVCLEASGVRIGQRVYYENLVQYYSRSDVLGALFHYLLDLPDVPQVLPTPPDTELRRQLMEKSLSDEVRFLKDLAARTNGCEDVEIPDGKYVTAGGLLPVFRQWLFDNGKGTQSANLTRLGGVLKRVLGNPRGVRQNQIVVLPGMPVLSSNDVRYAYVFSVEKIFSFTG
ncbi:hypothetical protein GHT06_003767 [Daphnia sinensis]|uniref:NrS-1 polymerase-like helicase domain-containing protein n=1 Tax=Daphnia sinensis TaxID=1820382 RepID=A0AAD5KTP0_9CRUS|nr:hypothetical protein GHT06_003767 [Daphnia sinensis]